MTRIRGTRFYFETLGDWCDLVAWRANVGRASAPEYRRQAAILQALTVEHVAAAVDVAELRRLDGILRRRSVIAQHFDREHRVDLVIATHNRIHQLETGAAWRERVRHGPADPSRMPDRALERVIQSCRDLGLVERCREERRRRQAIV